ncbi:MAG: hypothetical protein K0R29_976 [Pseudobdellovibrio sp.]|jgi:AcrR family transcriptional regulator|nr:hypothetical protein [Pseudobdellovibrio sp.]
MAIKNKKKPLAKKAPRKYDNTTREKKSDLNRQKIVDSYVDLLVANAGQDVTLQSLAKKTKISMRTLFRFFGDKEKLNHEIEIYLSKYLGSISAEIEKLSVAEYAAFTYEVFDRYERLFKAYLYTSFGQLSRRILRRRFHEMLIKKIIFEVTGKHTKETDLPADVLTKIRFTANLISAQMWNDLQESYSLTGKDIAPAARWAVQTLLKDLNITL